MWLNSSLSTSPGQILPSFIPSPYFQGKGFGFSQKEDIPIFHVNDIVKEVEPRNVPADRSWCNGCGQLFKPDKDKAVYQCPQCDQVERKCIYSNQCLGST